MTGRISKKKIMISGLGEAGLIKRFRARCRDNSPEIVRGIGDDAAAISGAAGTAGKTLVASDMMIEGVHFNLLYTTFYQLGCKILAVNISDIFAMGGTPKYFLLSLGMPGSVSSADIDELYSGLMKTAKKFGVAVIGGDTCESGRGLVLGGTIVGSADKIITRSGAVRGDGIFVTGTLGDSAMGLFLLRKLGRQIHFEGRGMRDKGRKIRLKGRSLPITSNLAPLFRRHLMPGPLPLKKTSGVTSMIDISDGLLLDLSRLCDESKVGALIHPDNIPVSGELAGVAKSLDMNPVHFAMKGGEDYVLLFTAPSDTRTDAFRIGEIIEKGRFIADAKGRRTSFQAEGYEHFKKQIRNPCLPAGRRNPKHETK